MGQDFGITDLSNAYLHFVLPMIHIICTKLELMHQGIETTTLSKLGQGH
jgi:hypothetical protein